MLRLENLIYQQVMRTLAVTEVSEDYECMKSSMSSLIQVINEVYLNKRVGEIPVQLCLGGDMKILLKVAHP